jgi:hypothetical protein
MSTISQRLNSSVSQASRANSRRCRIASLRNRLARAASVGLLATLIGPFGRAADVGSPEWIVETFFTEPAMQDAEKYDVGEMRNHPAIRISADQWSPLCFSARLALFCG